MSPFMGQPSKITHGGHGVNRTGSRRIGEGAIVAAGSLVLRIPSLSREVFGEEYPRNS